MFRVLYETFGDVYEVEVRFESEPEAELMLRHLRSFGCVSRAWVEAV
jgi:hypothetical protein